MSAIRQFLQRVRALFRKEKLDRDMAEEMRFHLAQRAADHIDDGLSPDEARYAAQRKFGGVEQIKERCRQERGFLWLEQWLQDVRHAARALAARLWPGEESLGRHLEWAGGETPTAEISSSAEIVGIARTMRLESPEVKSPGAIYVPFAQGFRAKVHFILRSVNAGETALTSLREPVRRELQAVAPSVPLFKVLTFREHKDASLVPWLFQRMSAVLAAFGAMAVLIAIIGLYGAKAYSVSRRTREIGIRLALGAEPSRLRNLIFREGLALSLVGIALGLLLGAALGHFLGSVIGDLDGSDPVVFSIATLALFVTALAASWLPARRAMKVSPMVALRCE